MMNLRISCMLVFFTLYLQDGLSREYEAKLGADVFYRIRRQSKPTKSVVTDYHVGCTVVSRYAVTTVQSSVWNQLPVTKEAAFEVDLPSSAFISNFTITSNGKVYVGQVTERAAARNIYDAAKKQGKTAGLVATKEREIEKFRVAVSVPSGARVSFSLTYEELLPRRLGRYELSLGLRPGQPVQNLSLDVSITERTGISFLKAFPLRTSRLLSNTAQGDAEAPASTHVEQNTNCARVRYSPTIQQQNSISSNGLNADFILQYDVELRDLMGEVQTKQAMSTILGDLREGDHFNIITFSDKVHTWKKGRTVRATRQNVRDAKDFLVNPSSSSSSSSHLSSRRVPLVIFLTDGEATIGVTTGDTILSNAKKALGSSSLFGLAFGDDADFLLLKRLALDNRGVARMVYEDADAALQLKGFYDEVASPLLSDIQLSYLDDQAFDITRSMFPNYFQGSELVVAGRVKPGLKDFKVSMSATDSKQRIKLENEVLISHAKGNGSADSVECSAGSEGISTFVHRLWAYFTIKELLLAKLNATDPATQRILADKATNLSLKYNFVTPVTSLVVVKPDADEETPTTVKPTTAATTTTTAATTTTTAMNTTTKATNTAAIKILAVKKLSSNTKSKTKPDPHQPPQKQTKKVLLPTSTAKVGVSPSKKATTTSSPTSVKTAPAPISGKKPTPSQNESKTASPLPVSKTHTSLLNALKTVAPPAPGKVSTPYPNVVKTTPTTTTVFTISTTPPPSSVRTDPALLPGKPLTPQPSTVRTTLPPVRVTVPSLEAENSSTSAPPVPDITTPPPEASSLLTSPTPVPAPSVDDHNDTELSIATFVSATFAPMPGVTDGPRLWEAAGLLDIDLVKDFDATYDVDYDLNYDAWDDTADTESFVDGDPHFVVQLPKLRQNLCFTVDGRANDVLRLLEDPERGIIVDGHLMGAPSKHGVEDRTRTYFDRITISSATRLSGDIMITLSLDAVVVEGEGRDHLPINQQGSVTRQGVTVTVDDHRSCWIELDRDVRFLVLFHQYKHPSYLQMAHLGFYIRDGRGLSAATQGLLGQFQHADMRVSALQDAQDEAPNEAVSARGVLRWGAEHMPVTLQDKTLKDTVRKRHTGMCWVVPKAEVERLLGHPYESYVVEH
ncbi:hypothetical protein F7725_001141, partial [Dissostichus mawsoni]